MKITGLLIVITLLAPFTRAQDVPRTPAAVDHLVSVTAFQLETPYRYDWRADRPWVHSGYLVVLSVDPALVRPRQTAEPVLYVGGQPAERMNQGTGSGQVIAIVPAVLDDRNHPDYLDLEQTRFWFGNPALPEQLDEGQIRIQQELADDDQIDPFASEIVSDAQMRGGDPLLVKSKHELLDVVLQLITQYAPDEKDLIERLSLGR